LAKKVFKSLPAQAGNLVGVLSTLTVGFNYDLINYATSGASESPFIFEIVAATYFASLKKWWATVLTFSLLVLMYFTRPLAFIYIAGIILYWLLVNFKPKKAMIFFVVISAVSLLIDHFVLSSLSGKYFTYSILSQGNNLAANTPEGTSVSNMLRGSLTSNYSLLLVAKKIFYNLYNFFKLLRQIMSPYLFALFAIGLFLKSKSKEISSFKIASVFMVVVTFLVVAASIPFFRYLHPIVPLIYIIAVGTLVEIINKFQETKLQTNSNLPSSEGRQISKKTFLVLGSCILVLLFGVGQTIGVLTLDSRFEASTHNVGKPPVYVELSEILKANTTPNQVVITNLDTWGSWYGERKTVWFPLEPKQMIDPLTGKIPFDSIYLTSYLIDDPNYYMGTDWRMIFDNPTTPAKWTCDGCQEIGKEFKLKGVYSVPANSDYEKQDGKAILLIRK
jgi:hypothetical protein